MARKLGFQRASTEITRAGATITGYSRNKKRIFWRKQGFRGETNLTTQKTRITSRPSRAAVLKSLKAAQRKAGR